MAISNIEVKIVPISVPANISIISDPNIPSVVSVVPSPGPQGASGIPGQTGPQGPQGIQGLKGDIGGVYTHNQSAVSTSWIVNHNLGFNPSVAIVDSGGTSIEADIWYNNTNSLEIILSVGISGKAYLS